jgi:hypothetical protein
VRRSNTALARAGPYPAGRGKREVLSGEVFESRTRRTRGCTFPGTRLACGESPTRSAQRQGTSRVRQDPLSPRRSGSAWATQTGCGGGDVSGHRIVRLSPSSTSARAVRSASSASRASSAWTIDSCPAIDFLTCSSLRKPARDLSCRGLPLNTLRAGKVAATAVPEIQDDGSAILRAAVGRSVPPDPLGAAVAGVTARGR